MQRSRLAGLPGYLLINMLIFLLLMIILVGFLSLVDESRSSSDSRDVFALGLLYYAALLFPVVLLQVGISRSFTLSRAWALIVSCLGSVVVAILLTVVLGFDIDVYLLAAAALPIGFAATMWLPRTPPPWRIVGALSIVAGAVLLGIFLIWPSGLAQS